MPELSDVEKQGLGQIGLTLYLAEPYPLSSNEVSTRAQCWGNEAGKHKRQFSILGPYLARS